MTTWDEEFDLIAVGSGAGGLAAAIAAADAGLRAVVLEKSPRVGGNTVWSYGIVWVGNNDFARAQGIDNLFDATMTYLDYLGGGRNDPDVTRSFMEHAPTVIRYLEANAKVPFYLVRNLPDHISARKGLLAGGAQPAGAAVRDVEHRTLARPARSQPLRPWARHL